jgi:hypothetical protein
MREHGASLSLSLIERRRREKKREKKGKERRRKKVFFRRRETRRCLQIAHGEKRVLSSLNTVPFFLQLSLATSSSLFFSFLFFFFFLSPVQPLMFCSHPLSFLFSL